MACRTLLIGLAVFLAGCSGAKTKRVYPVSGHLTFDGQPMANARIAFVPSDPELRSLQSHATADAEGVYRLNTYRQFDGAPAGDYVVTIYWPTPPANKDPSKSGNDDEKATPDRLKNAYTESAVTPLRATVRESPNEIDFKLP